MSSADILLNSNKLNVVETFKYLRVTVDSCLNWELHISQLIERVSSQIALLNRLAGFLDTKILLRIYKQTILPVIGYGCIVWHECNKSLSDKLEQLQNQAMRVILRANRTTCTQYMRNTLGLLTLYNRRRFLRFVFTFEIVNNQNCPKQLEGFQSRLPQSKTSSGRKTFQIAGASDWNSLPAELRKTISIGSSKFNLFKQLHERQ